MISEEIKKEELLEKALPYTILHPSMVTMICMSYSNPGMLILKGYYNT